MSAVSLESGGLPAPGEPGAYDPLAGDPVIRFLADGRRCGPAKLLLAYIVLLLLPAFSAVLQGTFFNDQLRIDLAHDLGFAANLVAGVGAVWILFTFIIPLPQEIERLSSSRVLGLDERKLLAIRVRSESIVGSRIAVFLPFVATGVMTPLIASKYMFTSERTWHRVSETGWPPIASWLGIPAVVLLIYLLGVVVVRLTVSYRLLSHYFKEPIEVGVFHEDGCGGLAGLGRLIQKLATGILLFGAVIVMGVYSNVRNYGVPLGDAFNVLMLCLFVVCASGSLLMPVRIVHGAMLESRARFQSAVNHRVEKIRRAAIVQMNQGKRMPQKSRDELESIETMTEWLRSMPVYPFDWKGVVGISTSIVLPVVLALMEKTVSRFFP